MLDEKKLLTLFRVLGQGAIRKAESRRFVDHCDDSAHDDCEPYWERRDYDDVRARGDRSVCEDREAGSAMRSPLLELRPCALEGA